MNDLEFAEKYLQETVAIAQKIDRGAILKSIEILRSVKKARPPLCPGVGGSAGNASHASTISARSRHGVLRAHGQRLRADAWTNDSGWTWSLKAGSRVAPA